MQQSDYARKSEILLFSVRSDKNQLPIINSIEN